MGRYRTMQSAAVVAAVKLRGDGPDGMEQCVEKIRHTHTDPALQRAGKGAGSTRKTEEGNPFVFLGGCAEGSIVMEQKKTGKKVWWAVLGLIIVVAALVGVYLVFGPKGTAGEKTITVDVVLLDGSDTQTTITTDAEFLRGALEQENMIEGTESDYGLYVTTVNGVTADESKEQWWSFTKGGEFLETGVDSTPIADGDAFEITLVEGY